MDQELRQSRSDWEKIATLAQDRYEWHVFVDVLSSSYKPRGKEREEEFV